MTGGPPEGVLPVAPIVFGGGAPTLLPPAVGEQRGKDLSERRHALMVDVVRVAFRRQPHPIDREQDDGLLIGRCGYVRHDKWQRGSFRIVATVRGLRHESRHRSPPPGLL